MRRRGQVHWKGGTAHERRPEPQVERTPSWFQSHPEALTVGAMFTPANEPLGHLNATGARTTPPTLTKLFFVAPSNSELVVVPKNGLMVYAGTVRQNLKHDDRIISRPKYTFIHGVGRYIIDDLESIRPLE